MKTKLRLTGVIGCLMISGSLAALGCGDDAKTPNSATNTGGADGGQGGSANSNGGAGVDAKAGSGSGAHVGVGGSDGPGSNGDAGSGNTGTGARPNIDPGGPNPPDPDPPGAGGGGSDSPDFDGVDLSDVSEMPPEGCVGGFDPAAGTLSISVGGDAPVVHVAVLDGVIQANGVNCESAKGDPAEADKVLSLAINGSDADDAVYLDLSGGPFTGCFADAGAIAIDLGGGSDRVVVLGTAAADVFHAGSDGDKFVLDVSGDERADVSVSGKPVLLLSLGGKGDEVRADGVALGVDAAKLPLSIYGGGANDTLVGGAANDNLVGGLGNDWFDAGTAPSGGDVFDGGDGTDTIDFSARTAPLVVTIGLAANDGEDGEDADIKANVENIYGGQATNDINGGPASNNIWGGPADDKLVGGPGDDTISGGPGNDTIEGDAGNDYLYGEEGDDALDGGADDDLLDGLTGKNTLNAGPGDGDICISTKADKVTGCEL